MIGKKQGNRSNLSLGVSIVRSSDGMIRMYFMDEASRLQFLSVEMTAAQFGLAVTSQYMSNIPAELIGSEHIGKVRCIERRTLRVKDTERRGLDSQKWSQWLRENYTEPGWLVDTYLGTRGAIAWFPGKAGGDEVELNFSVFRFVPAEELKQIEKAEQDEKVQK